MDFDLQSLDDEEERHIFECVIEEIALEGLDGITLEALWDRLVDREGAPIGYKESPKFRWIVWNVIRHDPRLSFHVDREPRPELHIWNRMVHMDDRGNFIEPSNAPEDIYPFKSIEICRDKTLGVKKKRAGVPLPKEYVDLINIRCKKEAKVIEGIRFGGRWSPPPPPSPDKQTPKKDKGGMEKPHKGRASKCCKLVAESESKLMEEATSSKTIAEPGRRIPMPARFSARNDNSSPKILIEMRDGKEVIPFKPRQSRRNTKTGDKVLKDPLDDSPPQPKISKRKASTGKGTGEITPDKSTGKKSSVKKGKDNSTPATKKKESGKVEEEGEDGDDDKALGDKASSKRAVIRGSCTTFNRRKDVTRLLRKRKINYAQVCEMFGNRLVIVACQNLREFMLFSSYNHTPINGLQYCMVERIGRSRHYGEQARGKTSLTCLKIDAKTQFYLRKYLLANGYIAKQGLIVRFADGRTGTLISVFHLPYFFQRIESGFSINVRKMFAYICSSPNKVVENARFTGLFGKHLVRTFREECRDLIIVRDANYSELHPEEFESEPKPARKKMLERKTVRVIQLKDPELSIRDLIAKQLFTTKADDESPAFVQGRAGEDENEEEFQWEFCYPAKKYLAHEYEATSVIKFVITRGNKGFSVPDLVKKISISHLDARSASRYILKCKLVKTKLVEHNKTKIARYVYKKLDGPVEPVESTDEEQDHELEDLSELRDKEHPSTFGKRVVSHSKFQHDKTSMYYKKPFELSETPVLAAIENSVPTLDEIPPSLVLVQHPTSAKKVTASSTGKSSLLDRTSSAADMEMSIEATASFPAVPNKKRPVVESTSKTTPKASTKKPVTKVEKTTKKTSVALSNRCPEPTSTTTTVGTEAGMSSKPGSRKVYVPKPAFDGGSRKKVVQNIVERMTRAPAINNNGKESSGSRREKIIIPEREIPTSFIDLSPYPEPPPKKTIRKVYYDEKDRTALGLMRKQRVDWTAREDRFLLNLFIASILFIPRYNMNRTMIFNAAQIRDLLHKVAEESVSKTAVAVRRRIHHLMKNRVFQSKYRFCLTETLRDETLYANYIEDHIPQPTINVFHKIPDDALLKVFEYILNKFNDTTDFTPVEIKTGLRLEDILSIRETRRLERIWIDVWGNIFNEYKYRIKLLEVNDMEFSKILTAHKRSRHVAFGGTEFSSRKDKRVKLDEATESGAKVPKTASSKGKGSKSRFAEDKVEKFKTHFRSIFYKRQTGYEDDEMSYLYSVARSLVENFERVDTSMSESETEATAESEDRFIIGSQENTGFSIEADPMGIHKHKSLTLKLRTESDTGKSDILDCDRDVFDQTDVQMWTGRTAVLSLVFGEQSIEAVQLFTSSMPDTNLERILVSLRKAGMLISTKVTHRFCLSNQMKRLLVGNLTSSTIRVAHCLLTSIIEKPSTVLQKFNHIGATYLLSDLYPCLRKKVTLPEHIITVHDEWKVVYETLLESNFNDIDVKDHENYALRLLRQRLNVDFSAEKGKFVEQDFFDINLPKITIRKSKEVNLEMIVYGESKPIQSSDKGVLENCFIKIVEYDEDSDLYGAPDGDRDVGKYSTLYNVISTSGEVGVSMFFLLANFSREVVKEGLLFLLDCNYIYMVGIAHRKFVAATFMKNWTTAVPRSYDFKRMLRVVMRPWITAKGEMNWKLLDKAYSGLLGALQRYPIMKVEELCRYFIPIFSHVETLSLLTTLLQFNIVGVYGMKKKAFDLFSYSILPLDQPLELSFKDYDVDSFLDIENLFLELMPFHTIKYAQLQQIFSPVGWTDDPMSLIEIEDDHEAILLEKEGQGVGSGYEATDLDNSIMELLRSSESEDEEEVVEGSDEEYSPSKPESKSRSYKQSTKYRRRGEDDFDECEDY